MSEDSGQEKSEQPTAKRLQESRDKGQVPRSKELNTMMLMLGSGIGLLFMGENILTSLSDLMRQALSVENARDLDINAILELFGKLSMESLFILMPLFILLVVLTLLTPIGVGGWSFSTKAMSPKWEKISPIKGLGRIFSVNSLVELIKVLAKFLLILGVSAAILYSLFDELIGLGYEPLQEALTHVARLSIWLFISCSAVLILVAVLDVPFQIWQHTKQLMMTFQEVKDENKETEGRPEVKGRIRALQMELSQRRMMEDVPTADVIITNPTHYAIALRYDQLSMRAPVVVAKGADLVAANIRAIAEEHDIAIVSAPPLARALFSSTEINQEIPGGLYVAVATILTYIYQLKATFENGELAPDVPDDLPIPDELVDVLTADR